MKRAPIVICWLLTLAGFVSADTWENTRFGVRLVVPDGWSASEQTAGTGLRVDVAPDGLDPTVDFVRFSLRLERGSASQDPDALRERLWEAVEPNDQYRDRKRLEQRAAGRDAPGVEVDANFDGRWYRVRQCYVVERGMACLLESIALPEGFAGVEDTFASILASVDFSPSSPEQARALLLAELAARCGSEVVQVDTWDEAVRRSRDERKPILVPVFDYPGFDITNTIMTGPFMDQDIVTLLNERYVVLRYVKGMDAPFVAQEVYGMGPHTFGEAALIVDADGQVLADGHYVLDEFLRDGLVLDRALPGPPPPRSGDRLERAQAHFARGELERVVALLGEPGSAAEHYLLARVHARQRRVAAARAEVERARQAPGLDQDLALSLDLHGAALALIAGQVGEAVELLRPLAEREPAHDRTAEALYLLGVAEAVSSAREVPGEEGRPAAQAAAAARWSALVDDHPGSRWAWLAAANLTSTAWAMGYAPRAEQPSEEGWARLAPPDYARANATTAERDVLRFVLEQQDESGGWNHPTVSLLRRAGDPPHDFELAISAISVRALLLRAPDPEIAQAIERGTAWLFAAYDSARAAGSQAHFMDYSVWSRAYMLGTLAELLERKAWDSEPLVERADAMVAELAALEKPGGGWSYYVTGDLSSPAEPQNFAMSFTTAAVVLALLDAREAGIEVPQIVIENGLDCIERAGNAADGYHYMVGAEAAIPDPGQAGRAGRGPVCALALLRGGRRDVNEVRAGLDLFLEHADGLAHELGKHLMHAGPEAQGCHYLMFDYANAVMATTVLAPSERVRYRERVLREMLRAHTADGAFLDTLLNGRDLGAGLALLAFSTLRAAR